MLDLLRSTFPIQILGKVMSLAVASMMAQGLSLQVYGTVAFLFTVSTFGSLVLAFGLPRYFISILPSVGGPSLKILGAAVLQICLMVPLVLLLLFLLRGSAGIEVSHLDMLLTALLALFQALSQSVNYAIRSTGVVVRTIALEVLLQPLLFLLILILLLPASAEGEVTVTMILLGYALCYFITILVLLPFFNALPARTDFKLRFTPQIPFFMITLTAAINVSADIIMLGIMSTADQVAYYRIGVQLLTFCSFLQISLNTVLMQRFSKAFADGAREQLHLDYKVARILNSLYVTVSLVLFYVFGKDFVSFVFGPSFLFSLELLWILGSSLLLVALMGPIGVLMQSNGSSVVLSKIMVVGGVSNLCLNSVLIGYFDAKGAALATAISNLITVLSCAIVSYQKSRVRE